MHSCPTIRTDHAPSPSDSESNSLPVFPSSNVLPPASSLVFGHSEPESTTMPAPVVNLVLQSASEPPPSICSLGDTVPPASLGVSLSAPASLLSQLARSPFEVTTRIVTGPWQLYLVPRRLKWQNFSLFYQSSSMLAVPLPPSFIVPTARLLGTARARFDIGRTFTTHLLQHQEKPQC
jgi:hypothetical protein